MPIPSSPPDDLVRQLGRELDGSLAKSTAEAEEIERQWQETLQGFREAVERIAPIFKRAEQGSSEALRITFTRELHRCAVELEVAMAAGPTESATGSLRYAADPHVRQIVRTVRIDRAPRRDHEEPVSPADLTPEQVNRSVEVLFREVRWSLEG
jgi:hypothetical protein